MPVITKIENKGRRSNRVNIYVDNQFYMQVDQEIVYLLYLSEGKEVSLEQLDEIANKDAYIRGKEQALRFLRFRGRTEKEIREKLKQKGFQENIIDEIVEFLKEYDFVNDTKLASQIVQFKQQEYGKNRIRQELYKKGISDELIQKEISQIDEKTEYEKALKLAQKKRKEIKDADKKKIYGKIGRYLIQKGYEYETVMKVLNNILR